MNRSRVRNKYLKFPTVENISAYRPRSFCVKLFKKEKKKYHSAFDSTSFTGNKMILCFSEKRIEQQ